jgi:hypothetical protein
MSGIPELERVRFFSGELLTADDLAALDSNNRELRWLHNRTLHNWGIGFGFDLVGKRGDTLVTVNPGYAIDIDGREIILSRPVQRPIPAVPGSTGDPAIYYLVANYVEDANEPVEQQRSATACAPGGAVRLSNDPAILWKTVAQLNTGIDVLLGQVSIQNCVLSASVSATVRRYATSASRFSLSAADIAAKDLQWTPWKHGTVNLGFTAAIDTSAAKFQSKPQYMAQIIGSRSLDSPEIASPTIVVVDFVSTANESPTGFTLQVSFPALAGDINPTAITDPNKGPDLMAQLGWRIAWIGVEG